MGNLIYGVDPDGAVSPLMVRDAIVECFRQAHCIDSGIITDDPSTNRIYCWESVKKAFTDAGADFDAPTKDTLLKALEKLKQFSLNFRDQSLVQKHFNEIMQLVGKLQ